MPKPLKSRHLQSSSLRKQVLGRQGVSIQKRQRLGHSGHFAKTEIVAIERKPTKASTERDGRPHSDAPQGKKNKSKNNKFKNGSAAGAEGGPAEEGEGGDMGEYEPEEQKGGGKGVKGEVRTERLEGESFSKFMKRLNKETCDSLNKHQAKQRQVSVKRKDFLKGRKKDKAEEKKSRKAGWAKHFDADEEPSATVLEEQLRAAPAFGEQALRPPIIRMSKPMKGLTKEVVSSANSSNGGYIVGGVLGLPETGKEASNKREFEKLRKTAISQYRGMMAKKRWPRASLGYRGLMAKKREANGHVSIGQLGRWDALGPELGTRGK